MGIMPSLYLITGRYVCVCVHSLDKSVKKKSVNAEGFRLFWASVIP